MNSPAAALLYPDVMLPEQYFAPPRPAALSPERRLMLAVLEEAVLTLVKHRNRGSEHAGRLVRDAEHWITATDSRWPFAFANICAALHLDPDYVRKGLLALTRDPAGAQRSVALPFARRVAGRRHRVGLIHSHRKAAS